MESHSHTHFVLLRSQNKGTQKIRKDLTFNPLIQEILFPDIAERKTLPLISTSVSQETGESRTDLAWSILNHILSSGGEVDLSSPYTGLPSKLETPTHTLVNRKQTGIASMPKALLYDHFVNLSGVINGQAFLLIIRDRNAELPLGLLAFQEAMERTGVLYCIISTYEEFLNHFKSLKP